jgi:integrase
VLRASLNQARRWLLVVENVAELVEVPRHRVQEIQPLTPDQARTLIDSAKGHRLGAIVSVATAAGLRLGEALGLRWSDVNLEAGTLSVRQALERSGGDSAARRPLAAERKAMRASLKAAPKRSGERRRIRTQLEELRKKWRKVRTTLRVTEPKSTRSRRTIRLPVVVASALKTHRTGQLEERLAAGKHWEDSGLVFTSPIGTAMDPRNVSREFQVMLAAADVPHIRFHDLRHTAATLLLAQGVDPRTIMETLGHSQISLTLNTYSHVLPALQSDAADKMDAILKR